MNRLRKSLQSGKLQLFVSLPANDPELAKAAVREGADGLKVHIHVDHRASGNRFGPLAAYKETFAEMRSMYQGPLGIVPGGSTKDIRPEEIHALPDLGIDFFSIYAWHLPAWLLNAPGLARTFAIDDRFDCGLLPAASGFGMDGLEASIVPAVEYGTPLSFADLLKYRSLAHNSGLPVIVPSQRCIVPRDVPHLIDSGVKALLIGAVSTGTTAETVGRSVYAFRSAIDQAGG